MVNKVTRFLSLCWSRRSVDSVLAGKTPQIMQRANAAQTGDRFPWICSWIGQGLGSFDFSYITFAAHFLLHKDIKVNCWDKDQPHLPISLNSAFDLFVCLF